MAAGFRNNNQARTDQTDHSNPPSSFFLDAAGFLFLDNINLGTFQNSSGTLSIGYLDVDIAGQHTNFYVIQISIIIGWASKWSIYG